MLATRSKADLSSLLAAVVAFALLGSVTASASEPAEDPAALAATYEKQAAEFHADAQRHAQIARAHRAGTGSPKIAHDSIAQHCERIAENLTAAAKESEALAESYRALTKK